MRDVEAGELQLADVGEEDGHPALAHRLVQGVRAVRAWTLDS